MFQLEKPNLTKIKREQALQKYTQYLEEGGANLVQEFSEPEYYYWDKAKYRPVPENFLPEEVWYVVRQSRRFLALNTPIKSENGKKFTYTKLNIFEQWLHQIDMETGGRIFTDYKTLTVQNKERFLKRGIIEEAIASSQLEGANTSRRVAKEMIMEKREPRTSSERMILNNYNAMVAIEENFKNQEMSLELLLALHRILTEKDLPYAEQGNLRKDTDNIVVYKKMSNVIVHIPPSEAFLKEQIPLLVNYANDDNGASEFVHPIIKAALLHFWIGYLHPFTDGNGRMARAIFYWYMLRKGYWTMMYLPISTIIKKSLGQYGMAYVYSEQDDNDVTYFLHYHLKKVILAAEEFQNYIDRKLKENKDIEVRMGIQGLHLNDRQKQVLNYLLSEGEGAYTTAEMHTSIYGISRLTAYKDLQNLEKLGLLESNKIGKQRQYKLAKKYKSQDE